MCSVSEADYKLPTLDLYQTFLLFSQNFLVQRESEPCNFWSMLGSQTAWQFPFLKTRVQLDPDSGRGPGLTSEGGM